MSAIGDSRRGRPMLVASRRADGSLVYPEGLLLVGWKRDSLCDRGMKYPFSPFHCQTNDRSDTGRTRHILFQQVAHHYAWVSCMTFYSCWSWSRVALNEHRHIRPVTAAFHSIQFTKFLVPFRAFSDWPCFAELASRSTASSDAACRGRNFASRCSFLVAREQYRFGFSVFLLPSRLARAGSER